jgi:hypothetical protein
MYCLELLCCLDKKCQRCISDPSVLSFKNVEDANKKTASCVVYVSNQSVSSPGNSLLQKCREMLRT